MTRERLVINQPNGATITVEGSPAQIRNVREHFRLPCPQSGDYLPLPEPVVNQQDEPPQPDYLPPVPPVV